jgi:hypothetical protein
LTSTYWSYLKQVKHVQAYYIASIGTRTCSSCASTCHDVIHCLPKISHCACTSTQIAAVLCLQCQSLLLQTSYFYDAPQVAFRTVEQCVLPEYYNDHVKDKLMLVVLGHTAATAVKHICDKLLGTLEMVAALASMPSVLSDAPFAEEFEVDDTEPITIAAAGAAAAATATAATATTAPTAAAARGASASGHDGYVTAGGSADAIRSNGREKLAGTRSVRVQTTYTTQVHDTPLLCMHC